MQWLEPRPARRLPIRLTPLIDVVFILLLFFMLTSYMTPLGLVQLDTVSGDRSAADDAEPPATLHITRDGTLRWNDSALSADELRQRLADYPGDRVQLSTDGAVTLSDFTQWLTKIRQQGLTPQWQREPREEP